MWSAGPNGPGRSPPVERLDTGPPALGSRVRRPRLPTALWTVTELVPGHHFLWQATGPGTTTIVGHFVAADGEQARARARLDQHGPGGALVGWLSAGPTRRHLDREVTGLKDRAETAA